MRITVIRSVPPAIIGSIGIVPDHEFEAFEARLDAVEASGVIVERLQPEEIGNVIGANPVLHECKERNPRAFPVVLVNDKIVCAGRYPTSTEWAHALGACRRAEQPVSTN